ncbi:MAG: DUF393 domain-containing protein [Parachlamydiales bacterium]|nr:DUF393 domain-containing protein [Parachlamydiales bacterium]
MTKLPEFIIFFDGTCVACNRFLRFMKHFDKGGRLYFSPLQGETIKKFYPQKNEDLDTVIYLRKGKILKKSTAVIYSISDLGQLWCFTKILLVVPRFVRDWIYDYFAKNRYRWFGSCQYVSNTYKDRFLN